MVRTTEPEARPPGSIAATVRVAASARLAAPFVPSGESRYRFVEAAALPVPMLEVVSVSVKVAPSVALGGEAVSA